MAKIKKFILESFEELRNKVSWPSYGELQKSTVLVLIGTLILAVLVGTMNISFKKLITWLYSSF